MSRRSLSTFATNSEAYVNCASYDNCEARKELLNSVNRSNVNKTVIVNFDETPDSFTTLLHAAIRLGDKFMCDRLLSIKELNLKLADSEGEDIFVLVQKLKREGDSNNRAIVALEAFVNPQKNSQNSNQKGAVSRCFSALKKLW
jgi:hypothetical protein